MTDVCEVFATASKQYREAQKELDAALRQGEGDQVTKARVAWYEAYCAWKQARAAYVAKLHDCVFNLHRGDAEY